MRIINIASSDTFEEILEAVSKSKDADLILVVPKSNRVFKSKPKTEKLHNHFNKVGKNVSIISSVKELEKSDAGADKDIASFYSKPSVVITNGEEPSRDLKKFLFSFFGVAATLFLFIVLASLTKAEIKITPRKSDFSIDIPLTVTEAITKVDEVYGMIPGKWLEAEKTVFKTFPSTGRKEVFQKAKGRITIYNNFSASPQVLVATTRFQTAAGLVFRILQSVTVPGAIKTSGQLKQGEIEVEIVSDRAGEEYNIEPSDFKIPGFSGTPKYQGFYAKSFEKFSGGFVGLSDIVTKEDIQKAEETVKGEAINELKKELASLNGFKILEPAVEMEFEKTADSAKAGDLAKDFNFGFKAKAKTMAFRENDIIDFISRYVKNSQNFLVLKKGLKIEYAEPKLDGDKRELSLKLVSSGKTMENIDKTKIIIEISGKKKNEADSYLNSLKEVESAQIISPFWTRKIPKSSGKVNVEIVGD